MNLVIYQGPSSAPWEITGYVPHDSLSLLQAELGENDGVMRASLSLELYNKNDAERALPDWRARVRKPGILVVRSGNNFCFALYYDAVKTEYDPTTRRYRLHFTSLLDALRAYLSRDKWWNVLDAATLMASFKEFLGQYLPTALVNATTYLPDSMSPLQEDPENPAWPYFAGFVQPASWLVGKQVDYETNGPWTIISVLGVARSLVQDDTIFALCLAKPQSWWSTQGDYVLPIVIRAVWNTDTWDWDVEGMYWYYDPEDENATWWWPVWFGMKKNLSGETGDSALIYTTATAGGERVVCAWVEADSRKPGIGEGNTYMNNCWLRCVLLLGDLTFSDQRRIELKYWIGLYPAAIRYSANTIILRGGGYVNGTNMAPAGAVFIGVNGIVPYNCEGEGPDDYGLSGQDGLVGVGMVRWQDSNWIDDNVAHIWGRYWIVSHDEKPMRLLDFEVFPRDDYGLYEIHSILGRDYDGGNLALRAITYTLYTCDCVAGTIDFVAGDWWLLKHDNENVRPTPCFAIPCGPAYYDGEKHWVGFTFGYTILEIGEGGIASRDGVFVDVIRGSLDQPDPWWPPYDPWADPADFLVNPDNAGFMELDIPLDAGGDERHDPRTTETPGWDDEQCEQNLASQLRTLIACRMKPFALRYEIDGDMRRVKFLLVHNSFREYEVFALSADYDPVENEISIYTLDGRDQGSELVPKIYGGQFNEADTWRPLCPYHSLWDNENDPRSTTYDHQGNFGIFSYPVGWASFPVVRKVCENEKIYPDMGKLGYQNMMNPDYRYWWNIYNAQRGHLITTLSWWSFVEEELDYRKGGNLDLMAASWDSAVHGISYVAEKVTVGGATRNRLCLVFVPRFPIRGDTQTISGQPYWEQNKSSVYSDFARQVAESGFRCGFLGRYWDSLLLGPQGGAILNNIWWDDDATMNSELILSVPALAPQWFGTARWRGGLYTDLLIYLRENEFSLGGLNARLGLRELIVPVRPWLGPIRIGSLVNQDIMEDLETLGDQELTRYRDENGEIIPLFWQVVGLRWDVGRNTAVLIFREARDHQWARGRTEFKIPSGSQ